MYEGKGLIGEDGIFTKLMQRFINAALEGEVTAHIKEIKKLVVPIVVMVTHIKKLIQI